MSDDFPLLPEGLPSGPNIEQYITDLRDEPIRSRQELMRRVISNLDGILEPDGWDQPDRILVLMTLRTGQPTGVMWLSELNVPDEVRGDLSRTLPGLVMVLSVPIPEFVSTMADTILGQRPEGSIPLALIGCFEGWGVSGSGPADLSVLDAVQKGQLYLHPDAVEQRHFVLHSFDCESLHGMRTRGQEGLVFMENPDHNEHPVIDLLERATHLLIDATAPATVTEPSLN